LFHQTQDHAGASGNHANIPTHTRACGLKNNSRLNQVSQALGSVLRQNMLPKADHGWMAYFVDSKLGITNHVDSCRSARIQNEHPRVTGLWGFFFRQAGAFTEYVTNSGNAQ
jgi:hypothetical protein